MTICQFCKAKRCVCVVVARIKLVAAEWNAAEEVIARARELVTLAKARGEHVDGAIQLDASIERYDLAALLRSDGA